MTISPFLTSLLGADVKGSAAVLSRKAQNSFSSSLSESQSDQGSDVVSLASSASTSSSVNSPSGSTSSSVDSSPGLIKYSGYSLAEDKFVAQFKAASLDTSIPRGSGNAFSILTTLTPADKQLVKQATGWDIDSDPLGKTASPEASALAGRLNLDRYSGNLTGPITQSYLQSLAEEKAGGAQVPIEALYKAEAALGGAD